MKVNSVWKEPLNNRYVVEFKDRGITWFRYLNYDAQGDLDSELFKGWLNSMIEDVRDRA